MKRNGTLAVGTFDDILRVVREVLSQENVSQFGPIIINRDLRGRVRLILKDDSLRDNSRFERFITLMSQSLGIHGYPPEHLVLFESASDFEIVRQNAPHFQLDGFEQVTVVDRLITETDWSSISEPTSGAPRMVFYSIKGGVGRSTAMAVTAWYLAGLGKKVMVLDLDLESPGISSSMLSENRRPTFGMTDWLVEDLVDNGNVVLEDMVAISDLPTDGKIFVVPAHGRDPGEYLVKLGRAWMSKPCGHDGTPVTWSARLRRVLDQLETKYQPDAILIDSRAGIDEVASACITELGAGTIFMFAIDGEQTWTGYDILFRHWLQTGKAGCIRESLQAVGSMIPETGAKEYFEELCGHSYNAFTNLYDGISPDFALGCEFNFDINDRDAPHYPWPIRWHRGFAALQSLHSRFLDLDDNMMRAVFGEFIDGICNIIGVEAVP